MPPRPPPSPPALTFLSCLSALAAAFAALAAEQAMRGVVGFWVGVPWRRFGLMAPWYLPHVWQDGTPHSPGGWLAMLAGGPVALALAAIPIAALLNAFRVAGWLRSLALSFAVVGVVWLPAGLIAAALPGGGGPIAELYAALGNPRAGRWGAGALGLLLLGLVAGPVSRLAVATGRGWMRADGREFRRRLVRVVAAYPSALAMFLFATAMGWMPPVAAAAWAIVILVTLVLRTA